MATNFAEIPRRNIELKARLADLAAARQAAERLATQRLGALRQIDTYFHCPHGRLKLREIEGTGAELIYYERPDQLGPKGSDYYRIPVGDPEAMRAALAAALGTRVVIDKRREVFLVENVRIHLDDVAGLGTFLEFEAVLEQGMTDDAGHAQLARLTGEFGLVEADLCPLSYSDLALIVSSAQGR